MRVVYEAAARYRRPPGAPCTGSGRFAGVRAWRGPAGRSRRTRDLRIGAGLRARGHLARGARGGRRARPGRRRLSTRRRAPGFPAQDCSPERAAGHRGEVGPGKRLQRRARGAVVRLRLDPGVGLRDLRVRRGGRRPSARRHAGGRRRQRARAGVRERRCAFPCACSRDGGDADRLWVQRTMVDEVWLEHGKWRSPVQSFFRPEEDGPSFPTGFAFKLPPDVEDVDLMVVTHAPVQLRPTSQTGATVAEMQQRGGALAGANYASLAVLAFMALSLFAAVRDRHLSRVAGVVGDVRSPGSSPPTDICTRGPACAGSRCGARKACGRCNCCIARRRSGWRNAMRNSKSPRASSIARAISCVTSPSGWPRCALLRVELMSGADGRGPPRSSAARRWPSSSPPPSSRCAIASGTACRC